MNWEPTNDQTTNDVQPSSTSKTSYMFEAVNGINTSYMFEAVNVVNAKPFEAVNGANHNHDKIRVNIWVTFSDKQDDEIQSKSPVECNSWPKRSSTYTCLVLFPSFCAIGMELKCKVHSRQILMKSSSKRGLRHNKNSEQVRGNAPTQPCGLRHDKIRASWRQSIHSKCFVCSHQKKFHSCPCSHLYIQRFRFKFQNGMLGLHSYGKSPITSSNKTCSAFQMVAWATTFCSLCFLLGFSVVSASSIRRNCRCASASNHLSVDCWLLNCACIFLQELPVGCQVNFNLGFWGSAAKIHCCVKNIQNIFSLSRRMQNISWGRIVVNNNEYVQC